MYNKPHALVFLLICLAALLPITAAGAKNMEIVDNIAYHTPNQSLDMSVTITHDEYINRNSQLRVYVDSALEATIDLYDYLRDPMNYTYNYHPFSYNMTAVGTNTWEEYPEVEFSYAMTVSGYSGENCDTWWGSETYPYSHSVNATSGLKKVFQSPVGPPPDYCIENTTWTADLSAVNSPQGATPGDIELSMREVCGSGVYDGKPTDAGGWLYRELDFQSDCSAVPTTADYNCKIHRFDNDSLSEGYTAHGGPSGWDHGGIFKDGVYQDWGLGQVKWDGNTGYIRINSYDFSTYNIVYLPPNGPMICAYTDYIEISTNPWTVDKTYPTNEASYSNPYSSQWAEDDLIQSLGPPDCPCSGCNCDQSASSYTVIEYQDPDNAITVSFDRPSLTITGTSSMADIDRNFTENIDLSEYANTPILTSNQTVSFEIVVKLVDGGATIMEESEQFFVCADLDGDGYCEEMGDCNDTDNRTSPDGSEICDYVDNDCDGDIDEDFYGSGFECVLNRPCNDWTDSICAGTCSCTENGTNVTCDAANLPGEHAEVCLNGLDDDCDGETDEMWNVVDEEGTEGCVWSCEEGAERPCFNNIGFCLPGKKLCINGSWTEGCIGFRAPREEVCNLVLNQIPRYADDDCDGIIDNVYGGNSVEETKCQCYDGGKPKPESCNGIDDDCDGETDEKICRCSTGETKPCGNDKGICKPGIQYCSDGFWATECTGEVGPDPRGELCYNGLDDNCNGVMDEGCNIGFTCSNDEWDMNEDGVDCGGDCPDPCSYPIPWIIFSVIIIGFIVTFIVLEMKGKIPV